MAWRDHLEPDLGSARSDKVVVCIVCGKQKRVYSSAAVNASTCESCLPENQNPELHLLLRALEVANDG